MVFMMMVVMLVLVLVLVSMFVDMFMLMMVVMTVMVMFVYFYFCLNTVIDAVRLKGFGFYFKLVRYEIMQFMVEFFGIYAQSD